MNEPESITRLELDELPEDVQEAFWMAEIPGQDESEMLDTLKDMSASYPGFILARLNLACIQLQTDDAAGAESTYRAILSDFPDEQGAIGGLATVHIANKDFEKAEQEARRGPQAPPPTSRSSTCSRPGVLRISRRFW